MGVARRHSLARCANEFLTSCSMRPRSIVVMTAESGKTIDQFIAEQTALLQERLNKLARFKEVGAEFQRLATELGISIPSLDAALGVSSSPLAAPTEIDVASTSVSPPKIGLRLAELISAYRSNPNSSYQSLKHRVRKNYDPQLDRLVTELGSVPLRDFDSDKIFEKYDGWTEGGKIATGHSLIGKLRLLCTFGITILKDEDAVRLSTILNKIKVPTGTGPRTELLTPDHSRLIRKKAHEMRWHSVALIQALQNDFPEEFRGADIIGEWVPIGEPGASDIINDQGEKWLRGMKWSEIDDRLILRHMITTGPKREHRTVAVDLKRGPMVMEEIQRVSPQDRIGPLALCEFTGLPWKGIEFRRKWRQVATWAGVPKEVRFMDTGRKIADTESLEAEGS